MDGAINPVVTPPVSSAAGVSAFSSRPRSSQRLSAEVAAASPPNEKQMTFLSKVSHQLSSPTTRSGGGGSLLQHQPFVYPHQPLQHNRSNSSDWSGRSVSATVRMAMEAIHDVSTPDVMDSEHFDMQELEQELKEQHPGDGSSQSTYHTRPSMLSTLTPVVQKPIPITPGERSVTPMGRMREGNYNRGNQMATTRTDDEAYMAMKQKRWREKLRIANQRREDDRSMLDGDVSTPERTPPRRRKTRERTNSDTFNFPSVLASCRSEMTDVFEKLVTGRCGDVDDTRSDDSIESSTISTEYEDGGDVTTQATSTVFTPKTLKTEEDSFGTSLDQTDCKSELTIRTKFGMNTKQFVQDFIRTVTKSGIIMNLHSKTTTLGTLRAAKCLIFIQPGVEDDFGNFAPPKLIWKHVDGTLLGQIHLFAIKSLTKATALDVQDFPLAMPGRSVIVRYRQAVHAFEMRSEGDAFRFTHGMRWVLARLSFNLIIGNLGVSCELLDLGESSDGHEQYPRTVKEDARWTKAMNDVTCVFVDQSVNL